jgi:glycosyltransferase involved in cell wall biosynthesis
MPFRVLIVGRGGDKLGRLKAVEGVEIIGDPLDIAPFYARADVAIVPLRAGGGTRIKILEAFSYGVPVISTTIGAEGLKVTPGSDILIADDPEAFADECCRMIADESLRQRIAAAGRNLWESEYTPAALTSILSTIFRANIRTQPEATL